MASERGVTRRLLGLVPLQLVVLAIGVRYAVGPSGVPHVVGWALIVASLMTLAGYALAIWRAR
jgi:hypothetical protein